MRAKLITAVTMLLCGLIELAGPGCGLAIMFEIYTDRAVFDARLGGAVRVVDFDDIDTSTLDPAPFRDLRYRSKGVQIQGEDGQFVSRNFGFPADFPPSSAPNLYAPGGNETYILFYTGFQGTRVAGVGVVFVDADFPADGPSSLEVHTDGDISFSTGTVAGQDSSRLFRGIIAIDEGTMEPTPAISFAKIWSGNGFPSVPSNEGVALDDLVFATPQLLVVGEICDNCIDDDGDLYVDRYDGECDRPADGGETGLGNPALAKLLIKCQKTGAKAGTAFVQGLEKQLQSCLGGVLACLQVKPDDNDCLPKAQAKCAKARDKIDALQSKLGGTLGKSCDSVPKEVAFGVMGMGYDAELADCAGYEVTLNTGPDIGECVMRQHRCRATQLVSRENARAVELAKLGGLDLATDFPCLEEGANGKQIGLGDVARGKAVLKCQQAIAKAGATYANKRQKLAAKCIDPVVACIQLKPGDNVCLGKANDKCLKGPYGLFFGDVDEPKSLAGKAQAAIAKGCKNVLPADLLDDAGLGQGALAAQCRAIGVPMLESVDDVVRCLIAFQSCRADRLVEKQYPRAIEFLVIAFD